MDHPLDRPVWSALTTRQAALAQGGGGALRFAPEYGPFGALADGSTESLAALVALNPAEGGLALVEADPTPLPAGMAVEQTALVNQMIAEGFSAGEAERAEIEPLGEADAAEMHALATLTRPGPFSTRTHRLGDFVGVRSGGKLVAMAGERMKLEGFTEVSGVCTHPEWRGRGYAAALTRTVTARIASRGETPFLHVYPSNLGAIAVYEALGFRLRRVMTMRVLAGR